MVVIFVILFILVIYGVIEYTIHQRNLKIIPMRVHVNGTRGKSSVTRLIAAGLREGGVSTLAKTTGTKPRIIFEDGTEEPIYRPGKANIIEQTAIVKQAASRKVKALVIECMGIKPELQGLIEKRMVRSTIGVITNVREDHMDEMGPTKKDVAVSLSETIPGEGVLFTAEQEMLPIIKKKAEMRGTEVVKVDEGMVSEREMDGFKYIEHRDNVAIALAVANYFGIEREIAIQGMHNMNPDPGALRRYRVRQNGKEIEFINAFAANDPESTLAIWKNIVGAGGKRRIVILTSREDRPERSRQLAELIASQIDADHYILNGEQTDIMERRAITCGLKPDKITNLGKEDAERVYAEVLRLTEDKSLVVGIGNILGYGERIVAAFRP